MNIPRINCTFFTRYGKCTHSDMKRLFGFDGTCVCKGMLTTTDCDKAVAFKKPPPPPAPPRKRVLNNG